MKRRGGIQRTPEGAWRTITHVSRGPPCPDTGRGPSGPALRQANTGPCPPTVQPFPDPPTACVHGVCMRRRRLLATARPDRAWPCGRDQDGAPTCKPHFEKKKSPRQRSHRHRSPVSGTSSPSPASEYIQPRCARRRRPLAPPRTPVGALSGPDPDIGLEA